MFQLEALVAKIDYAPSSGQASILAVQSGAQAISGQSVTISGDIGSLSGANPNDFISAPASRAPVTCQVAILPVKDRMRHTRAVS
jgi:hypothetical protein